MKKGISLVALIVTVIVLIILSAAAILSFQEGGIIDRADQAVEDSNDAVLEEKITMMNLEYTQKLKKKFTPETRATLKAIVEQSGIDLDKLLVYYEPMDGEQYVFYRLNKVTKKEAEWFLEKTVTVGEESKKIYYLMGDINFDGEITVKEARDIELFSVESEIDGLPKEDENYCKMLTDINGDRRINAADTREFEYIAKGTVKYSRTMETNTEQKAEYVKTYFGIE